MRSGSQNESLSRPGGRGHSRQLDRGKIISAARRLARDGAESLADAQEGFQRISLLVTRLKGFARRPQTGAGNEPVDLAETATRAAALVGVGLPVGTIEVRSDGPVVVRASDDAVVQILVNLMLNAVQASRDLPHVEVEIRTCDREVEISVADRGHGLDAESLGHIFDPFYTTRRNGSGLGLSISFDLARRMNGRIEAVNRSGGGAVFSLFLPLA